MTAPILDVPRTPLAGPGIAPSPRAMIDVVLTAGAQAEVYADHFIANQLKTIGGGKTHDELSTEAHADPTDTQLAATVNTMLKREPLHGLLRNAMATTPTIAAFTTAALMLVLPVLGVVHICRRNTIAAVG